MTDLHSLIMNLTSGDDQIAEDSAKQIAALGEHYLPTLFSLLASPDPDYRWWILRVLAEIQHPEVPPRFEKALRDPDSAVRQCAVLGLIQQPTVDAIPDLMPRLEDTHRLLARLAGDVLITIGSPAIPQSILTLESGNPSAQIEATRALALIGDKNTIPALFKAWQDGSTMVQHWRHY